MKVYKRLVIDIGSGRRLAEESYYYIGPVARADSRDSETKVQLPKWLKPYAQQFIESYQGLVYDEDGNIIEQPEGLTQEVVPFTPAQRQAMDAILARTGGMQDYADLGVSESSKTLQGDYLNPETNPYLEATYNKAARGLTDQYSLATAPSIMAGAQKTGNFGGSAYDEVMAKSRYDLGENLGNLATSIYGGNYTNERQNMLKTLGLMPTTLTTAYAPQYAALGIGASEQEQAQAERDTEYINSLNAFQFPFEILSGFGGALGQAGMGSGKSTTTAGGGGLFGSVICTELHRQGIMDDETYAADQRFGQSLPVEVIRGYHHWAIPVARAMARSRFLTLIIAPIAMAWAKAMKATVEGKPQSAPWLGQKILRYGVPFCRWLGKNYETKAYPI